MHIFRQPSSANNKTKFRKKEEKAVYSSVSESFIEIPSPNGPIVTEAVASST